jgi:hypothetical protein
VLTVVNPGGPAPAAVSEPAAVGGSVIDEIVRDGARRMLAALEAEVAAYIATHADQLDEAGRRLVVRNGHARPRQVLTSAGAVEVAAPRVNDKRVDETGVRRRFASAILPAWCRKSPQISEPRPGALLQRSQAQLTEPAALLLGVRARHTRVRLATPLGQCVVERHDRPGGLTVAQPPAGLRREPGEHGHVHGVRRYPELIARGRSYERLGRRPQRPPQPGDVGVDVARGARRWLLAPDRVDQLFLADRAARVGREDREHRALPGRAERQLLAREQGLRPTGKCYFEPVAHQSPSVLRVRRTDSLSRIRSRRKRAWGVAGHP